MSDYVYINASFCFNIVFKHIVQLVDFFFKEISFNMSQMQKKFEWLKADKYTDQWRCIQAVLGWRNRGRGGKGPSHFLTDQLTLSQPGGADYAHDNTTCPHRFSDLLPSLQCNNFQNLVRQRFALDYDAMPILNQMCEKKIAK